MANHKNLIQRIEDLENEMTKTLYVKILELDNPVGHIRFETTNINPEIYLGFGTWVLWGAGKVPVGVDESDTDFATVEKIGGEKAHTLTEEEMPEHTHIQDAHVHSEIVDNDGNRVTYATGSTNNYRVLTQLQQGNASGSWRMQTSSTTATNQNAGSSKPHNNVQPYITCYMWKRIA